MTRTRLVEQVHRTLKLLDERTTDLADEVMRLPVARYVDGDRWQREVDELFRSRPQVLALGVEVPSPGSYVARRLTGVPVVVTRDESGRVRGFLNVCRHRGGPVAADGCGSARALTCGYHAWSYALSGELLRVPAEGLFGEFDHADAGLVELPVAERAGLVFGCLRPDADLDLDGWLGEFGPELDDIDLGAGELAWTHEWEGPNWKLCKDGFLETYHFPVLHAKTINREAIGNVMPTDTWGQHARILIPRRSIHDERVRPEDEWDVTKMVSPTHYVFPNTMLSGSWGNWVLVSRIYPDASPERSTMVQTLVSKRPLADPEVRAEADRLDEYYRSVTFGEDYVFDYLLQSNLESGANTEFLIGRNELALQHFHTWVDRLCGAGPDDPR
ncbi:MAG: aromatic ring-hydroxylating dioxygenase subunit alpha [Acidimicrobiia bacterium]